ncbi:MAG: GcrA family cell cycle regulator [Actinobacteria bacterium]|nr:GcrA family cell cycle regulator [Actinomycetota bacterium]
MMTDFQSIFTPQSAPEFERAKLRQDSRDFGQRLAREPREARTETVAGACFPALDFRPLVPKKPVSEAQVASRQAREARREFTAKLREREIEKPVPKFGCFTILDLEDGVCRWAEGDGPFRFCGKPTGDEKLSYCGGHSRVAYRST